VYCTRAGSLFQGIHGIKVYFVALLQQACLARSKTELIFNIFLNKFNDFQRLSNPSGETSKQAHKPTNGMPKPDCFTVTPSISAYLPHDPQRFDFGR
jgi:hypothetical protein